MQTGAAADADGVATNDAGSYAMNDAGATASAPPHFLIGAFQSGKAKRLSACRTGSASGGGAEPALVAGEEQRDNRKDDRQRENKDNQTERDGDWFAQLSEPSEPAAQPWR